MQSKIVSIVGSSYFQPIADLIETLLSQPYQVSTSVQASVHENGYSNSIILLLVAMLESYTCRLRYVQRDRGNPTSKRAAPDIISYYYPECSTLEAIRDVYVLCDAIFHNHVWEIDFEWGKMAGAKVLSAEKDPHSGDSKFLARVTQVYKTTNVLKLHVVPIQVDRSDVLKVFQAIWETLMVIEENDRMCCYVSHLRVRFKRKGILFKGLMDLLMHNN